MLVTFEQWTRNRAVATLGTNTGAEKLPFQNWRHFKEAFAPELVARAISDSEVPVSRCLDPFGGSGTSGLACQFLDVHPITAEVNPYLADLIEAKLTTYNPDKLACDLGVIARMTHASTTKTRHAFSNAPESFIEPGINGRWLFDRPIADRIAAILHAISALPNKSHKPARVGRAKSSARAKPRGPLGRLRPSSTGYGVNDPRSEPGTNFAHAAWLSRRGAHPARLNPLLTLRA